MKALAELLVMYKYHNQIKIIAKSSSIAVRMHIIFLRDNFPKKGSVAEWSKALVLGTSPKGHGFESHLCHIFLNTI